MSRKLVVEITATQEGRVAIRASNGMAFSASPQGATRMAEELKQAAQSAAEIAATDFVAYLGRNPEHHSDLPSSRRRKRARRISGAECLAAMLQNGYLVVGEELRSRYPASGDNQSVAAVTVSSEARLMAPDGEPYDNPSRAAAYLLAGVPPTYNGWAIWKAQRGGKAVSLLAIRRAMDRNRQLPGRTAWPEEQSTEAQSAVAPPPSVR